MILYRNKKGKYFLNIWHLTKKLLYLDFVRLNLMLINCNRYIEKNIFADYGF